MSDTDSMIFYDFNGRFQVFEYGIVSLSGYESLCFEWMEPALLEVYCELSTKGASAMIGRSSTGMFMEITWSFNQHKFYARINRGDMRDAPADAAELQRHLPGALVALVVEYTARVTISMRIDDAITREAASNDDEN